jgi:hypothetical protein
MPGKVVIYKSVGGNFAVVDVPDSYTTGDQRPAPQWTDRYHSDKVDALRDASSRHRGQSVVLDESDQS